jgi:penicillin-binding protein 1A
MGDGTGRRRWARAAAAASIACGSLVPLGLLVLGWLVFVAPGPHLERAHLQSVIAQESVVTYRDGVTRFGVFSDGEHRRTLRFAELPVAWVVALVATEDARFWRHFGVDPWGVGRALLDDLRAGAWVAGGSTLTQQAAKNLFHRPDRSLASKLVETTNALRLEAHYDKAEILELYANQFHVAGNGRGIGIAARHLFDKEPGELDLAQCAFIAGMVKAPSRLDPFFGDSEAWRAAATERAHARTAHVLRRIVAEPTARLAGPLPIDRVAEIRSEAQRLLDDGFTLPFRRGAFRFDDSAALDEVARRLGEPPLDGLLREAGIDDPQQAGIVVVTTLDPDAQREASYALWHHLTEVGVQLEERTAADLPTGGPPPRFDPDRIPVPHTLRDGLVVEHVLRDDRRELVLDLGGHKCRVDRAGVVRLAAAEAKGAAANPWQKTTTEAVDAFAAAIPDGAVVLASVREAGEEVLCDLELRPKLQGAVVVVQDGELRAMVGGNDDRNYNRARAPRQLGSAFKPLVYHAALTLGWSPTDPLDNRRNVFPYDGGFYLPNPDHPSEDEVSVAWAGVRSENLASVWLLQHLLDPVDDQRVGLLAAATDLALRDGEDEAAWRVRLGELGVRLSDAWAERRLDDARREVLRRLPSSPHPEDAVGLWSLSWGAGFAAERGRAQGSPRRLRALDNDWQWLEGRVEACRAAMEALYSALRRREDPDPEAVRMLSVGTDDDDPRRVRLACGTAPAGFRWVAPPRRDPDPAAPPLPWHDPERLGLVFPRFEDVRLDDRLHLSTMALLSEAVARRGGAAAGEEGEAPPEVGVRTSAFRSRVATRYVATLAGAYGVRSDIREVPSLPLGVSELTLEEAAVLYAGLTTGAPSATAPEAPGPARLISEIRTAEGDVVYRAAPRPTAPVAEPAVGAMTADILRNVVLHGTGVRARDAVLHGGRPVPVGGKTGTTNDYRNAAFVGFVPVARPDGYVVDGGFTVAAYVGYDDNRSMSRGRIRLSGASGALPVWIGAAAGLAGAGLLGDPPSDEVVSEEGGAWPLLHGDGLQRVPVDGRAGLPVRFDPAADGPQASVLALGRSGRPGPVPHPGPVAAPAGGRALAELVRVGDDRRLSRRFALDRPTELRVRALGEGRGGTMADYAWIEDLQTGGTAWEMSWRRTEHAGGAQKNRLADERIRLLAGTYVLHYVTDDSHAWDSWNAAPPDDPGGWGVRVMLP